MTFSYYSLSRMCWGNRAKAGGRNPCLSHARGRAAAFTPSPARIPSGPQRNVLPQIGPYRRSSSGVVRNLTGGSSTTVCRWLATSPSLPNTMAKKQDEGKPHLVAMHPPVAKKFLSMIYTHQTKNIFYDPTLIRWQIPLFSTIRNLSFKCSLGFSPPPVDPIWGPFLVEKE